MKAVPQYPVKFATKYMVRQPRRRGVNRFTAHSPTTFWGISISKDFRPSVRSSWRMR